MIIDFKNKTTDILKQEINKKISEYRHNTNDVLIKYGSANNKDVGVLFGWWFMLDFFYIDLIFVDNEYRKKGLATMLIKELINEMKQKNDKAIYIMFVFYDENYILENIVKKRVS